MHKDLELAFQRVVEILKEDARCKGGWHYGSISRGSEDVYSDYDPVFLVEDKDFEQFAADAPKVLAQASDELLIFWGESFKDDHFKNYCSVIRLGSNLHQFDFFIINAGYPEAWMCRQHCKGYVDLLLSQYDNLDWGAWESKVKNCVPEDKQEHLKSYFATADFGELETAVKKCMSLFRQDAEEICKAKGIDYPDTIARQIISYFNRRMDSEDWV